jgi:hypothetical protein
VPRSGELEITGGGDEAPGGDEIKAG